MIEEVRIQQIPMDVGWLVDFFTFRVLNISRYQGGLSLRPELVLSI